MESTLSLVVVRGDALSPQRLEEITALCTRAYEEDFAPIMRTFTGAVHVLALSDDRVVSHALWVERRLEHHSCPLLTAYVEAVATEPALQGRGLSSAVMRKVGEAIVAEGTYELAALSPSEPAFYERFGWRVWRGPLFADAPAGREPTPDEEVMVLALPGAPAVNLDGDLVAPWREGDLW